MATEKKSLHPHELGVSLSNLTHTAGRKNKPDSAIKRAGLKKLEEVDGSIRDDVEFASKSVSEKSHFDKTTGKAKPAKDRSIYGLKS